MATEAKTGGFTPDDECVEWIGAIDTDGYGRVTIGGRWRPAHRVVYEMVVGPIPTGLSLDHLCRNRRCVNPTHLDPTDSRTNTLRGVGPTAVNHRKTHCAHGHPLSGDNLLLRVGRVGRDCKECGRTRAREYQRRTRAALRKAGGAA